MYDKYLIVGEAFRNVARDGRLTGFQLGLRLPYYRGWSSPWWVRRSSRWTARGCPPRR